MIGARGCFSEIKEFSLESFYSIDYTQLGNQGIKLCLRAPLAIMNFNVSFYKQRRILFKTLLPTTKHQYETPISFASYFDHRLCLIQETILFLKNSKAHDCRCTRTPKTLSCTQHNINYRWMSPTNEINRNEIEMINIAVFGILLICSHKKESYCISKSNLLWSFGFKMRS